MRFALTLCFLMISSSVSAAKPIEPEVIMVKNVVNNLVVHNQHYQGFAQVKIAYMDLAPHAVAACHVEAKQVIFDSKKLARVTPYQRQMIIMNSIEECRQAVERTPFTGLKI